MHCKFIIFQIEKLCKIAFFLILSFQSQSWITIFWWVYKEAKQMRLFFKQINKKCAIWNWWTKFLITSSVAKSVWPMATSLHSSTYYNGFKRRLYYLYGTDDVIGPWLVMLARRCRVAPGLFIYKISIFKLASLGFTMILFEQFFVGNIL